MVLLAHHIQRISIVPIVPTYDLCCWIYVEEISNHKMMVYVASFRAKPKGHGQYICNHCASFICFKCQIHMKCMHLICIHQPIDLMIWMHSATNKMLRFQLWVLSSSNNHHMNYTHNTIMIYIKPCKGLQYVLYYTTMYKNKCGWFNKHSQICLLRLSGQMNRVQYCILSKWKPVHKGA